MIKAGFDKILSHLGDLSKKGSNVNLFVSAAEVGEKYGITIPLKTMKDFDSMETLLSSTRGNQEFRNDVVSIYLYLLILIFTKFYNLFCCFRRIFWSMLWMLENAIRKVRWLCWNNFWPPNWQYNSQHQNRCLASASCWGPACTTWWQVSIYIF